MCVPHTVIEILAIVHTRLGNASPHLFLVEGICINGRILVPARGGAERMRIFEPGEGPNPTFCLDERLPDGILSLSTLILSDSS